jgi:hypothetical protein
MKSLLTSKAAKHTAIAAGVGAGIYLGEAAKIASNPWAQAGCAAGIAFLGALGIGVAKRSDP